MGKTEGELAALKAPKPKGFWARLFKEAGHEQSKSAGQKQHGALFLLSPFVLRKEIGSILSIAWR